MSRHDSRPIPVSKWLKRSLSSCCKKDYQCSLLSVVRKHALKQLHSALDLCHSDSDDEENRIHDIRVHIKRLRAYGRILRYAITETVFKETDQLLKQTANALSVARDQHVLIASLSSLIDKDPVAFSEAVNWMKHNIQSDLNAPVETSIEWPQVIANLMRVQSVWQTIEVKNTELLQKGVIKTFKRSRAPKKFAENREQAVEQRHEWRKWVKHFLYQMKLLKKVPCVDKRVVKKQIACLDELGELLGQEHDYELLQDFLVVQADLSSLLREEINRLILMNMQRIVKIRKQTLKLGKKLEKVRPKIVK